MSRSSNTPPPSLHPQSPWRLLGRASCLLLAALGVVATASAQDSDALAVRGGYVVNHAGDAPDAAAGDGLCDTGQGSGTAQCTLRAAIEEANARGIGTRIAFQLPIVGGIAQIQVRSALPDLRVTLSIDGSSQPQFQRIDLDGRRLRDQGVVASGLVVRASGSRINGLSIHGFTRHGIELLGQGGHTVTNTFLGLFANGTSVDPNNGAGVFITESAFNQIGGSEPGARNLFAGGSETTPGFGFPAPGVLVVGTGAHGNRIEGNHFGLDASGNILLRLAGNGVFLSNAPNNTIGGTLTAAQRNVFGGCGGADPLFGYGILLTGTGSTGNVIAGNFIGLDPSGNQPRDNGTGGIRLFNGPSGNTIGGTQPLARNVVNGLRFGIFIGSEAGSFTAPVSQNVIIGNVIGSNAAGTQPLFGEVGVVLGAFAPGNRLGGTQAGERNFIAGHRRVNVLIEGDGATDNIVRGNFIGTDLTGTRALVQSVTAPAASINAGIRLGDGAQRNEIGGEIAGAGNLISGNPGDGVLLLRGSLAETAVIRDNRIRGNLIGVDASGRSPLPNSGNGIRNLQATATLIGGGSAARNVISGNRLSGVLVVGARSQDAVILGNAIGTDATAGLALPNGSDLADACRDGHGVHVVGTSGVTVGSSSVSPTQNGERNVIRFNRRAGIRIEEANSCVFATEPAAQTLVQVRTNSISDNAGLGIDVGVAGPDFNDSGDLDSGANSLLNAPVLQTATPNGTLLSYASSPAQPLVFDIYASASCDPSGFGEGAQLVAAFFSTSNNVGQVFLTLPRYGIAGKPFISAVATATNAPGARSSEFSNCVAEGSNGAGAAFQASGLQTFQFVPGGPPPAPQTLSITAINTTVPQSYGVSRNVPWITFTPNSGLTPAAVSVFVDPTGLPPGLNTGTLTITGSATTTTVNVQLQIGAPAPTQLSVAPTALVFQAVAGGANPAPQGLAVSAGNAQLTFNASDNASWLSVAPAVGITPGSTNASVQTSGLAAGTYQASISISSAGLPTVQVPVTLQLAPASGGANLVLNPGFEAGMSPWTFTAEAALSVRDGLAQEGQGYALLAPLAESSRVHQTLAIPCSGAAQLRFQLNVSSSLTVPTVADRLFVEITSPAGALQQVLASYSNLDRTTPGAYGSRGPFDLSAYACQNVRLQFRAEPNTSFGAGATSFRVDAVAVQ